MSDEEGEAAVAGAGVLEPAEQVAGAEFPVHAAQADHHSVQDAESGKLRGQSLVVQHRHRNGKSAVAVAVVVVGPTVA